MRLILSLALAVAILYACHAPEVVSGAVVRVRTLPKLAERVK